VGSVNWNDPDLLVFSLFLHNVNLRLLRPVIGLVLKHSDAGFSFPYWFYKSGPSGLQQDSLVPIL